MTFRSVHRSRPLALFVALVAGSPATVGPAFAQRPSATLRVTVVDQTGAVIIGATVTVTSAEPANTRPAIAPVKTADTGVATIDALPPGRYNVQAEFPGFQKQVIADLLGRRLWGDVTDRSHRRVQLPDDPVIDSVSMRWRPMSTGSSALSSAIPLYALTTSSRASES